MMGAGKLGHGEPGGGLPAAVPAMQARRAVEFCAGGACRPPGVARMPPGGMETPIGRFRGRSASVLHSTPPAPILLTGNCAVGRMAGSGGMPDDREDG